MIIKEYEYKSWKYRDMGKGYHPNGARWQAVYAGVQLQRGNEATLKSAIDRRIIRYPSSNGA